MRNSDLVLFAPLLLIVLDELLYQDSLLLRRLAQSLLDKSFLRIIPLLLRLFDDKLLKTSGRTGRLVRLAFRRVQRKRLGHLNRHEGYFFNELSVFFLQLCVSQFYLFQFVL